MRQLSEEDLKKVVLHLVQNDLEFQEAIAEWIAVWYKSMGDMDKVTNKVLEKVKE